MIFFCLFYIVYIYIFWAPFRQSHAINFPRIFTPQVSQLSRINKKKEIKLNKFKWSSQYTYVCTYIYTFKMSIIYLPEFVSHINTVFSLCSTLILNIRQDKVHWLAWMVQHTYPTRFVMLIRPQLNRFCCTYPQMYVYNFFVEQCGTLIEIRSYIWGKRNSIIQ